jgi:hypothetical protein
MVSRHDGGWTLDQFPIRISYDYSVCKGLNLVSLAQPLLDRLEISAIRHLKAGRFGVATNDDVRRIRLIGSWKFSSGLPIFAG